MKKVLFLIFMIPVLPILFFCTPPGSKDSNNKNESYTVFKGTKLPPTGFVSRKYPKLVNYYHWTSMETPANMRAERLAQWDVVVAFNDKLVSEGISIAKMRQIHPDIKILAWVPFGQSPDTSFTLSDNVPKEGSNDWFLKTISGKYVRLSGNFNEYIMNPYVYSYAWPKHLMDYVKKNYLDNGLYDGIFFDCLNYDKPDWASPSEGVDVNGDGLSDNTDSALWRDGANYLITNLRSQYPNKIFTGNAGTFWPLNCSYFTNGINGSYNENALGDEFGYEQIFNMVLSGYLNSMNQITVPPYYMIGTDIRYKNYKTLDMARTKNSLDADDLRRMRLGLGTALLSDGYYGFDAGDCLHGQLWWFDEYDVDLGNPLSAYTQSSSLYQRAFDNGMVFVNTGNTNLIVNPQSIFKDATTKEINNRFIIPSNDARILINSNNTDVSNLLLNGNLNYDITGWGFWMNNGSAETVTVENGEIKADITNPGSNIWDLGVSQSGFTIVNGNSYTLSFQARALKPCQIIGLVQLNQTPWTFYSNNDTFNISTKMNTYSFTFTMNNPTDNNSNFVFQIGGNGTNTIYFDNIILKKNP